MPTALSHFLHEEAAAIAAAAYRLDSWLCFLTRSFSDQQPLEVLLRSEATESHVAPVVVIDPQIAG